MERGPCPFCHLIEEGHVLIARTHAVAVPDAYPISLGHSLVVPRRHEAEFFELSHQERDELWRVVDELRSILVERHCPDGFNVGFNEGEAAGQTVAHAHVHLVPRYAGDVPDPRGGIRWVLPDRAAYWNTSSDSG